MRAALLRSFASLTVLAVAAIGQLPVDRPAVDRPTVDRHAVDRAPVALPLVFEPGTRAGTFVARRPGMHVEIDGTGARLALANGRTLALGLVAAAGTTVAEQPLPGRSHYLLGDRADAWRRDVPHASRVRCERVWPGVDALWYGRDGALEYDLVFAPGADPARAAITFAGADRVAVGADGTVALTAGDAVVRQHAPYAYQLVDGERREVHVDVLADADGRTIRFRPVGHDPARELVVDPVLAYGTYLGGSGADAVHAMATDAAGNLYVTGLTTSANFPVASPAQPAIAGLYDFFVAKLDPSATTILWSTWIGGNSGGFGTDEWPVAIAVAPSGEVAVLGRTESTNFPTVNAVQPSLAGGVDAVVLLLAANGAQLSWSTYLGGSGHEVDRDNSIGTGGGGIAVDAGGNVFVASTTWSADFPTANAAQPVPLGNTDAFVARFAPNGARLYASHLGGSGFDELLSVSPGAAGRVLLTGTSSGGFPTTPGAYDTSGNGGFVLELDVATQGIAWSSTFPAGIADAALDAAGAVYVVGSTSLAAAELPTTMGAHQPDHGGSFNGHGVQAFAAKLTAAASQLVWATYYGSPSDNESFTDVAVDAFGQPWAAGTTSEHFGTATSAALLVQFDSEGSAVVHDFTTARNSSGRDLLLRAPGEAWLAGETWAASGVATPGALQGTIGGNRDGFVARVVANAAGVRHLRLPVDRLTSSDARVGTVVLDGAAPAGGATIALTSSSAAVTVPSSVFVPAGAATALVPVASARVQAAQQVTITASWNGTVRTASVRLWPGPLFRAVPVIVNGSTGASEGLDVDAFGTVVGTTGNEAYRFHESTGATLLGPGAAHGIGDGGVIAGGNGAQAMRWIGTTGQPLGALQPGMFSIGYDADPLGRVVGFSDFDSGGFSGRRAFLWSPGSGMQNLGTLGGQASVAYAINRAGVVTGSASLANAYERPFLWTAGTGMVDLGVLPGYDHGTGFDVNDAGQVAGIMMSLSSLRAFRWTPGSGHQDLGVLPGDNNSGARGINAFGWTVGWSSPSQPNTGRAVRHANGALIALRDELSAEDAFAWRELVVAQRINDAGQIAGTGVRRGRGNGDTAFRLDPALLRPYGRGCAGLDGRVTALAGTGHPAPGNTITLHVSGRPGAIALLALGTGPGAATLPGGCELHLAALAASLAFVLDGAGTAALPITIPPAVPPQSLFLQAATLDAAAANAFLTTSNGLELRVL